MKKLNFCPLCEYKNFKFLFEQKDKNLNRPISLKIFQCEKCKALFPNPFPQKKDFENFYPKEEYYSLLRINENGIKTKLKIELYKGYLSKKKTLKSLFFIPLRMFFRSIPDVNPSGKVLDIGSGSGQFLYEMKKIGFDSYGIEPNEFDKESSKRNKLQITKGSFLENKYKKDYFDLITLNHVLEHLGNPLEFLTGIKRIIKKEGILVIGVPNTDSLAFKIFKKNWYQIDVPRHLINYNTRNLEETLNKVGFEVKRRRYNSRPSQFSTSLTYVFNLKKGGIFEKIINPFFVPFAFLVNILKKGDQIEFYCQLKPTKI